MEASLSKKSLQNPSQQIAGGGGTHLSSKLRRRLILGDTPCQARPPSQQGRMEHACHLAGSLK
jgi:hypothetical protein